MKLENWSIKGYYNRNLPISIQKISFIGKVYGHKKFNDGDLIETSYIIKIENNKIYTKSGSVYELGEVDFYYCMVCPDMYHKLLGE